MALIVDTASAVLQALMDGDPAYGKELIEKVAKRTGGMVVLLQGRVYPVLRELEADGYVRSWEGEPLPERGGRRRRYYEITALGRREAVKDRRAVAALFGALVEQPNE